MCGSEEVKRGPLAEKSFTRDTNVRRGAALHLSVDEETIAAFQGETVAAALLAAGYRAFRHTSSGEPRGLFCGMGLCYDCLVTIEGIGNVRACITPVREGMIITRLTTKA